jgi:hypothetical protein
MCRGRDDVLAPYQHAPVQVAHVADRLVSRLGHLAVQLVRHVGQQKAAEYTGRKTLRVISAETESDSL